jgi:hypothetical protein
MAACVDVPSMRQRCVRCVCVCVYYVRPFFSVC